MPLFLVSGPVWSLGNSKFTMHFIREAMDSIDLFLMILRCNLSITLSRPIILQVTAYINYDAYIICTLV